MLEGFELDDLEALADSLPGPHAWAWGTGDVFFCQACHISFEFGAEPVPQGPCELDPDMPQGGVSFKVGADWVELDEFIRRYGRAEASRRLGEAGLVLNPEYPGP
jgi:hypothetical protein